MGNVFELHPAEAVRHLSNYLADPGMPIRVNPRLTREGEVLVDLVENLARGGDFTPARIRNLKGKLEQLGPKWEQLRLDRRYLACLVDHVASLELQGSGAPAHFQSVGQSNAPLAISPSYKPSDKAVASGGLGAAERITPKRRAVPARVGNPTFFHRHFGAGAIIVAAISVLAGVAALSALSGSPAKPALSTSASGWVGGGSVQAPVPGYLSTYSYAVQQQDWAFAFLIAKGTADNSMKQRFLDDLLEHHPKVSSEAVRSIFYYAPERKAELEGVLLEAFRKDGLPYVEAARAAGDALQAVSMPLHSVFFRGEPMDGAQRSVLIARPDLYYRDYRVFISVLRNAVLYSEDVRNGIFLDSTALTYKDVRSGQASRDFAVNIVRARSAFRNLLVFNGADPDGTRLDVEELAGYLGTYTAAEAFYDAMNVAALSAHSDFEVSFFLDQQEAFDRVMEVRRGIQDGRRVYSMNVRIPPTLSRTVGN
ncbi:hypothetical protein HYY74_03060 [Candidatus Woesearchaeota archaeon]|nr:hypothetical protein [Candidatus Woesearchaeota archaeon]